MIRSFLLSELAAVLKAQLIGPDRLITRVTTDSRQAAEGDLFVALIGDRFDAHDFIHNVAKAGAQAVVVSRPVNASVSQLILDDTRLALANLGGFNRSLFQGDVVAVTGSAGKTSVKEMLAMMLNAYAPTLATQGNLNNDIGAPLTLLDIEMNHRYAVVELGASALGEIAHTVSITRPQVAILNNALDAHIEGFGSLGNIVKAKSEIYEGLVDNGVGVVNLNDPHASVWIEKLHTLGRSVFTFGIETEATLSATHLKPDAHGCFSFELIIDQTSYAVSLSVMGQHMVANALAALSAWSALELPMDDGIRALERYQGFKGRLQIHSLTHTLQLIDDTYNASPSAVRAAIDTLMTLEGEHVLVLGDMAELGEDAIAIHQEIGRYALNSGVDLFLATGDLMKFASDAFGPDALHFADQTALVDGLKNVLPTHGVILVKGSRSAAMEQVVDALLTMEI